MGRVTNEQLYSTLLDIKSDLGQLKAGAVDFRERLAQHVEDDKAMSQGIKNLELAQERQRGFIKAIGLVGSAIGAGVGYLLERLTLGHHGG